MSRFARPARSLLAAAFIAVAVAACGNSSSNSGTNTGTNSGTTGQGAASKSSNQWTPSPAGTFGKEPTITFPSAAPPTSLVKEDLITGTGAVAAPGDTVTVQYVGASYEIKKVFQASWNSSGPVTFPLNQVIPGWTDGVPGMKVGGRRELIIPAPMGYGAAPPAGSGIPPNETLIFIIDLLSVKSASGG